MSFFDVPQVCRPALPRMIGYGSASYFPGTQSNIFSDPQVPGGRVLKYGQDLTFGVGRRAPKGQNVGSTEKVLIAEMDHLLNLFARGWGGLGSRKKMADALFQKFLAKQSKVAFFEHADLNTAAAGHPNIRSFIGKATQKIEKELRDVSLRMPLLAPMDLGIAMPAFNSGSAYKGMTGDFGNGLKIMINGVQHCQVVATAFAAHPSSGTHQLHLKFVFYDVFGLDDDDVNEFGAQDASAFTRRDRIGFTAWWQLQHQFGYAPLVTRFVVPVLHRIRGR